MSPRRIRQTPKPVLFKGELKVWHNNTKVRLVYKDKVAGQKSLEMT